MSFSLCLFSLKSEDACKGPTPIPLAEILDVLIRHGCDVPEIRQGTNSIGLPGEEYHTASLFVKNDFAIEFGLEPESANRLEILELLFTLISDLELVMTLSSGGTLYVREDILPEIPKFIRGQFSEFIIVTKPEDCR